MKDLNPDEWYIIYFIKYIGYLLCGVNSLEARLGGETDLMSGKPSSDSGGFQLEPGLSYVNIYQSKS